ncbi:MAG: hypothetical protein QOH24_1537, partial [Verrucomicrobiota bacterium]
MKQVELPKIKFTRHSHDRPRAAKATHRLKKNGSGSRANREGLMHEHNLRSAAEKAEKRTKDDERFRPFFDLGLVGMAVTSPSKGILDVNDELCRILGYERNELLRKTWAEMTHPEDLARDAADFERVTGGDIDGYSMDKRWLRKDGTVIHTIMATKCVRRADGSVDYFIGLLQDITDRKRAEEKLRRSEAYLAEGERLTHSGTWAVNL